MRASLLAVVLLALVSASLAPTAAAHAAPDPLSIETHLLADEGEDAYYWYDGYDLYNLFVREAHWNGQDGLIFRYTLYGGFAPQPAASALHIEIDAAGADGATTLRSTTTDDQAWEGDLQMVALEVTEDEPPFTGVTARVQAFASYEQLGVAPGDALSGFEMRSLADEDLRDKAPGGVYLPGSGGMAEAPTDSRVVTADLPLQGAVGYFEATPSIDGSTLTLSIENTLERTGQHIGVEAAEAAGWTVQTAPGGVSQVSLDAGETNTLQFNVTADQNATQPLPVRVLSDLGGSQWLYIGLNGTTLSTASDPTTLSVDPATPPKESPLGPAPLLVALLAAMLVQVRRD